MNPTTLPQTLTHSPALTLARISEPHGYRFNGDSAHLQARLTVLDPAAYQRTWALQLWACPSAPTAASDLAGQIVAEVALPPMSEVADETEPVDLSTFVYPPVGGGEHFMALVLAAGQPGQYDEIHDVAAYPRSERFLQPRMRGSVGYRIDGNRVGLSVEHIENLRDDANCSGTLSLELWAMAAPYAGGAFEGVHLAGVVIGTLIGQTEAPSTSYDLPFSSPPAGNWRFVLMLREWTAAGYVTRDFTNFIDPVVYSPTPPTPPPKNEPPAPAETFPAIPELSAKAQPEAAGQDAPLNSATKATAAPSKPVTSKNRRPAPAVLPVEKDTANVAGLVSVNTATEEELTAVEGLSPKLARSIIKGRPFASLNELRQVKGISVKLLAGILSHLRL